MHAVAIIRGLLISLACMALAPAAFAGDKPPPGQGFIDVPGGPVWYKVTGAGDGLPLLALHGGPGGTSCGLSRLEALGGERPVIRYDQLGTGRSGRPDDLSLWEAERFVEELHVIRQELGLERFHLLGHSWGGALAAAYVIEKGTDGIASVVLSSPLISTPLWIEDANFLRTQLPADVQATLTRHEQAGTIDSEEYAAASQVFYERHVYGGERTPAPESCAGAGGNSVIYNYMWGPTEFRATGNLVDFDLTDRLHEIDVPVLFIAGEFDEARPERLAEFQRRIPGAQLIVIKDAAHASLARKPEEYRQALEKFLDWVEGKDDGQ
jgi:proline-specific peptidase